MLVSSLFVKAQTLKDALFSGKLKNQSGTVIRKGDDLSSKLDTASKTATDNTAAIKTATLATDTATKSGSTQTDAAVSTTDAKSNTGSAITATPEAAAPKETAAAPKSNNAIWKTYMDSVASTLKTEALASKKIKRGSYFVLVSYSIGTDGQVTIGDVSVSPENAVLKSGIEERLTVDTPRLSPVLDSGGTPRKVTKRYSFTLSKE